MDKIDFKNIKLYSIVDYLEKSGVDVTKRGARHICSSPFSNDSNPSFVVYPNNTFYDWSTGIHGDIIDLVMKIEDVNLVKACDIITGGKTAIIQAKPYTEKPKPTFNLHKYIASRREDIEDINRYSESRGIVTGYSPCKFFIMEDKWIKKPAMGFIHTDYNGVVCGVKMRSIDPEYKQRFSARGLLQYYVLDNIYDPKTAKCFIVESESSANSLYMVCHFYDINAVVISFGGVANTVKRLPFKYSEIKDKRLIIDYDGNEELYKERLKLYDHLQCEPVKITLPKGLDINTMYCNGEIETIYSYIQ